MSLLVSECLDPDKFAFAHRVREFDTCHVLDDIPARVEYVPSLVLRIAELFLQHKEKEYEFNRDLGVEIVDF